MKDKKITIVGPFKKTHTVFLNTLCLAAFGAVFSTVCMLNNELALKTTSSKYFWFYGSMGVVSVCMVLYHLFSRPRFFFRFSGVDAMVGALCLLNLLINWGNGEMGSTKIGLLFLCGLLYFYFRLFLSGAPRCRYGLLLFLLVTAGVEAVWGLCQLYGLTPSQHNLFPITGSFFNPGPYAGYLAVIIPIAFYYFLKDYKVWDKKWKIHLFPFCLRGMVSAFTCLSILFILPAAMSRASWLALIGGCAMAALVYLSGKRNFKGYITLHKKAFLTFSGILIIGIIIGGVGLYAMKKDSADGRTLIWKITLKAAPKYTNGVGLGHFPSIYGKEQAAYFASGQGTPQEEYVAGSPEYAFNEYLQILIEQGLAGFFLFTGLVSTALIKGVKNKRWPEAIALISQLIFAGFSYPFSILPFVIVFVYLLAACITSGENKTTRKSSTASLKISSILMALFLCSSVIFIAVYIYNRYPVYQAYKDWKYTRILYNMGVFAEACNGYEKEAPFLSDQVSFLFEYGRSLSQIGAYEKSNCILEKGILVSADPMFYNLIGKNYQAMKQYEIAEFYFRQAAYMIPNRLYPYYLLTE
ncbi:MAG: O-antigen ligase family protein, partial [Odoribacter sp.]|nr:O-antigen ligase family protein [Odoribacter sp.]